MNRSILIVVAVISLVMLGAFTGYAQTSGGTMDSSSSSRDMSTPSSSRMEGSMASNGFDMYRLNKLIGSDVRNAQGESLGDIRDFVVDPQGHVAFALIGRGGFLGLGEKLVAVPFTALSYGREDRRFTLDMDKDKFASAPAFEKDTDISNRSWAEDVYRYFGQTPYWSEMGTFRPEPGKTGTMSMPDQYGTSGTTGQSGTKSSY